ncbi:MAG: DUF3035 domain-containing protein [Pseudomonadota bacterium]
MTSTVALAGCSQLGNPIDVLTGKRDAPDEFLVVSRKPLQMPVSQNLPEPRLGARSQLEPDPATDAVVALLGPGAVPTTTGGASAGEQALLSAADATAANLPQTDAELQEIERALDENQPYEAPLLIDLLSGDSDSEVYEDALVPGAEARRLQVEGVSPTPIDPTDILAPPPEPEPTPEVYNDRLPNNRLPSAPTETAF